jgi:hypothetical protein
MLIDMSWVRWYVLIIPVRQEDYLSPGIRGQYGQYRETPSLIRKKNFDMKTEWSRLFLAV